MQVKLRHIQDAWLSVKADEIPFNVDSNNSKCYYVALKAIYVPRTYIVSQILSAERATLISVKDMLLEVWEEQCSQQTIIN